MLTRSDFTTDQEVRWCPGCGDYAILAALQRTFPELGIPKENIVFVSGIGCSGRFPYYMNTYGFHTIHGRATALASGLKITRPELSVWVVTGDGDGLSIGGNHLMHLLRRNIDVKVLLFNNQIYGLTKGQYSPTSEQGKITNTTPHGSIDRPINPIAFALTAGATFVARVLDIDAKGIGQIIHAAAKHQGSAFIEIYQNCNIFNDGAFSHLSDKTTRADRTLWLEPGKPLLFGQEKNKVLAFEEGKPVVKSMTDQAEWPSFEANEQSDNIAQSLCQLSYPDFPVPMGIFRMTQQPSYETLINTHHSTKSSTLSPKESLKELLNAGHIWRVS